MGPTWAVGGPEESLCPRRSRLQPKQSLRAPGRQPQKDRRAEQAGRQARGPAARKLVGEAGNQRSEQAPGRVGHVIETDPHRDVLGLAVAQDEVAVRVARGLEDGGRALLGLRPAYFLGQL